MLVRMTNHQAGREAPRKPRPAQRIQTMGRRSALNWLNVVRHSDVAIIYAGAVTIVAVALSLVPDQIHDSLVLRSSTNLVNLRHDPLLVLAASAFVVPGLPSLWPVPFLMFAYATAQRWVGRAATVFVAALGHVGATLFVSVLISSGIAHGQLARSVARSSDVGVSYGLACMSAFVISQVPHRWRPVYLSATAAYFVGPLLLSPSFTNVGHATSLTLGFGLALLAARVAASADRQPGRPC
jgi:hypothetical protein